MKCRSSTPTPSFTARNPTIPRRKNLFVVFSIIFRFRFLRRVVREKKKTSSFDDDVVPFDPINNLGKNIEWIKLG